MGFKGQVTVLGCILMVAILFWSETPRKWRFRFAVLWGVALALVAGPALLNRVRNLGALDLHKEVRLPLAVDRPGLSGRRVGPLRIHLTVPPEVQLETRTSDEVRSPVFDINKSAFPVSWQIVKPATREWTVRVATVPILVVLENDSYQPLGGDTLGWRGPHLCSVRVERLGEGGSEEVFRKDVPIPEGGFRLLPAERRSVGIDWPLDNVSTGSYKVIVEFPIGEHPVIGVCTRLF